MRVRCRGSGAITPRETLSLTTEIGAPTVSRTTSDRTKRHRAGRAVRSVEGWALQSTLALIFGSRLPHCFCVDTAMYRHMLPLGHLAVALLPVTLYTLVRNRRFPSGIVTLLIVIGTQLPDMIDKPLAWSFSVLPSGRMFAHSLVVCLPALAVLTVAAHRRGRGRLSLLFSAAYLSHLAGDFYLILFRGTDYYFFPNLFWPLLTANPDRAPSFAAHAPESVLSLFGWMFAFGCVTCYGVVLMYRQRRLVTPV